MKRDKKTVEPQGPEPLSLTIDRSKGAVLNEMARVTGHSKASIIRELLYAKLDKWMQERGV